MAGQSRTSGIDVDDAHFKRTLKAAFAKMTAHGEDGLQRKAIEVSNRAKELCPVDTGNLRASIEVGSLQHDRKGAYIKVGTNVQYAEAVEYGSKKRNKRAQPFMRPALAEASGGSFPMKHTDPGDQPEAA